MRIKRISVDGLFGIFNHDIEMKLDDRITIIHGMNGYGKTTILRMVNGLFNRRYTELRNIPFTEFRVELEGGDSVVVTKMPEMQTGGAGFRPPRQRKRSPGITVKLFRKGKQIEKADFQPLTADDWEAQAHFTEPLEQFVPGLIREGRNVWRYLPNNEELAFEDLLDRFPHHLPEGMAKIEKTEIEWLQELQKSVKVRFIESQRLLRLKPTPRHLREYEPSQARELSVAVHAENLAQAIQDKLAEYAKLSQSLDRTFPVRLVEQIQSGNPDQPIAELRHKLNELEDKRNRLQEAGLLDKQEDFRFQVPEELQEPTQRVLPVYVRDVEKKLSVFDDIAAKIDLLKNIVNSRFSFKKMSISKEKGFVFTTDDGHPLNPAHLSSGEQHMLVLFSELLFSVESNSLVMIDEPEISLHVIWQKQFLRDLQEVTSLAAFDVLIATHSPQIVYDRWDDLTVELKDLVEQPV